MVSVVCILRSVARVEQTQTPQQLKEANARKGRGRGSKVVERELCSVRARSARCCSRVGWGEVIPQHLTMASCALAALDQEQGHRHVLAPGRVREGSHAGACWSSSAPPRRTQRPRSRQGVCRCDGTAAWLAQEATAYLLSIRETELPASEDAAAPVVRFGVCLVEASTAEVLVRAACRVGWTAAAHLRRDPQS